MNDIVQVYQTISDPVISHSGDMTTAGDDGAKAGGAVAVSKSEVGAMFRKADVDKDGMWLSLWLD